MDTTTTQQTLMECLADLLRDPMQAIEYAKSPRAFLEERMGDADYSEMNVPEAVEQAVMQADVPPEMAEAIQTAVYQPAPMIRVPAPTEPAGDDAQMYPEREGYDKNVDRNQDDADDKNEYRDQADARDEYGGMKDRPEQRMDEQPEPRMDDREMDARPEPRMDEPTMDADPARMDDSTEMDAPVRDEMMAEPVDEVPDGYEQMDTGGYHVEAPGGLTMDTYSPDTYTPTEMNLDCVEYSVSNCVTTKYQDTPEVAEQLCHTRSYEDPYDRVDPAHDFADVEVVQQPDYEYQPMEVLEDRRMDVEVDDQKDDEKYDDADAKDGYDDADQKYGDDAKDPYDDGGKKYDENDADQKYDENDADQKYDEKYDGKEADDKYDSDQKYGDDADAEKGDDGKKDDEADAKDQDDDADHKYDDDKDPYDGADQKYEDADKKYGDDADAEYVDDYGKGEAAAPAPVDNGHVDEYGGGDKASEPAAEQPVEYDAEPMQEQAPAEMTYQEPEYVEPEPVQEYADPVHAEPEADYPEPDSMDDDMMVDG